MTENHLKLLTEQSDLKYKSDESYNKYKTNLCHVVSKPKYGLRPRTLIKRLQQEKVIREFSKKSHRSKQRPPPLSKYRRKTANARERYRMKEINTAFESLRKALPEEVEAHTSSTMTKITTLRHAVDYIQTLSNVLQDEESHDIQFFPVQGSENSSRKHLHFASNNASFHLSSSEESLHVNNLDSNRESLDSSSDFDELLTDSNDIIMQDGKDIFSDIPTPICSDPFDLILTHDRENIIFDTFYS